MSPQDQMAYLDYVMRDNYDGKPREILIREMAAEIVKSAEAYTQAGFRFIVRLPRHNRRALSYYSENDALPPAGFYDRGYVEVGPVRLAPALHGSPHVAQIIVERIIRPEWP